MKSSFSSIFFSSQQQNEKALESFQDESSEALSTPLTMQIVQSLNAPTKLVKKQSVNREALRPRRLKFNEENQLSNCGEAQSVQIVTKNRKKTSKTTFAQPAVVDKENDKQLACAEIASGRLEAPKDMTPFERSNVASKKKKSQVKCFRL